MQYKMHSKRCQLFCYFFICNCHSAIMSFLCVLRSVKLVDENTEELLVEGKKLALVSSVYQNGEQRSLFLYWFQVIDSALPK